MKCTPVLLLACALNLLAGLSVRGQDCKGSSLLIPGTELEYHNHWPKVGMFGKQKGLFEITVLSYKVNKVLDEDGTLYSYITKKGTAFTDASRSWETELVVKCTGTDIFLPGDFGQADTIYVCDIYPGSKEKKPYSSSTWTGPSLDYPLAPADNAVLKSGSYDFRSELHDPMTVDAVRNNIKTQSIVFTGTVTIVSRKVSGRETVKTPAGEFDCYKIAMTIQLGDGKHGMTYTAMEYFCPQVGLVKIEQTGGQRQGAYTELTRVTKK